MLLCLVLVTLHFPMTIYSPTHPFPGRLCRYRPASSSPSLVPHWWHSMPQKNLKAGSEIQGGCKKENPGRKGKHSYENTPPKFNSSPLKMVVSKSGISFSSGLFSGSMLNFWRVTIQKRKSYNYNMYEFQMCALNPRMDIALDIVFLPSFKTLVQYNPSPKKCTSWLLGGLLFQVPSRLHQVFVFQMEPEHEVSFLLEKNTFSGCLSMSFPRVCPCLFSDIFVPKQLQKVALLKYQWYIYICIYKDGMYYKSFINITT